ncbi:Sec-independent protein translocase subunit TatA [Microbacterium paludicola]|jgi:sec-independent protein translocase protein TatA|uniref:Sec-independent protein translocase protein TatA n=1 Tax=Microbacterium paludicola TaxID=300019 RepID=A0A4Y9FV17_9MICO|nr:Sec-independent protein translocase subunit TatA [Microbacterium paludicola]MBF0816112.1 Sec-independent protein translocase subunit TatA [Microbacterium paludicola]TFU33174.1 Sec-independent protein translocase subunit TatA [Microbacterium paludicola]
MGNLTGWHLLILLAVILLLFGAARLPALARSLGQSARVFRGEIKQMKAEDEPAQGTADASSGYPASGQQADRIPAAGETRTDEPGTQPRP